jgi:dephospho-CoA kinase
MPKIAITGGVGEGKSTVLHYLHELGISTLSSDVVARKVFLSKTVQKQIADYTGIALPILPEHLRDIFPKMPELRRSLNRIMHPLIRKELLRSKATVVEVPLLVETCMIADFEKIWVVTCGCEEQLRRVTARLGNEEAARRLIGTQLPTRAKLPFADLIVRTNCSEEAVKEYISNVVASELRF